MTSAQCVEEVCEPGRWPRYHRCTLRVVAEVDGKGYCRVHDPAEVQAREASQRRRQEQRLRDDMAKYRLARLLAELRDIRRPPDLPPTVAVLLDAALEHEAAR